MQLGYALYSVRLGRWYMHDSISIYLANLFILKLPRLKCFDIKGNGRFREPLRLVEYFYLLELVSSRHPPFWNSRRSFRVSTTRFLSNTTTTAGVTLRIESVLCIANPTELFFYLDIRYDKKTRVSLLKTSIIVIIIIIVTMIATTTCAKVFRTSTASQKV